MSADELYALGLCYWDGDGQPQDSVRAALYFHQAAQQGHKEAQYNFAQCCRQGKGVPKDSKQAAYWLCLAANQGYARAQYHLGQCYQQGEGVPKDDQRAICCFQRAAEGGHKEAQKIVNHYDKLDKYNKEREANANHLREEASAPSYPTEQQTSNHTPTPQAPQVSKKRLSDGEIVGIVWGGIIALGLIFAIISNFGDIIDWIFSERWHMFLVVFGIAGLFKALFLEK